MTSSRGQLRLVPAGDKSTTSPLRGPLQAALRLVHGESGAIVHRRHAEAPLETCSFGLSPEEEAACRSLARRLWQQPARSSPLPSTLGGNTLVAQRVPAGEGQAALVVSQCGASGKLDAERLALLRDVAALLTAAVGGTLAAERSSGQALEERRRADRVLAVNHALQSLANTEDIGLACRDLLAELAPQFPGVDLAAIWLVEADNSRLCTVAWRGMPELPPHQQRLSLNEGSELQQLTTSGETRLVHFGRGAGRTPLAKLAKSLGMASILLVPLRSRNRVTGLLSLASRLKRELSVEERTFLETLGVQLGGQLDALRQLGRAEAESERLQTVIDTVPVGIAMFDGHGAVTLRNRVVAEIWGHGAVDRDAATQGAAYTLLTAEGRSLPSGDSPVARAMRGQVLDSGQELILRQSQTGKEIPVLVNAVPTRDASGGVSGVIAVYQDITNIREIDRLKDDFINTVSHELRTPTTTVRGGALTLLKRGDQLEPDVRKQLLRDMADEAERLYHLVEDLLGLSRVQAGMQLQSEPMIVRRFVNKVIVEMGGRVGNHALTVEVPNDLPLIEADPTCLEQVMRNLLENAVKFSPKGRRIEITAVRRDKDVLFSVLDRGSGIPSTDMDRVFEPFYRTEEAVRTGAQGAGLGLTVSRRLIEIQGGKIWAEARHGGGTAFHFSLPALDERED